MTPKNSDYSESALIEKPALKKMNPWISEILIDEAIKILISDRSLMGMASANREVFKKNVRFPLSS